MIREVKSRRESRGSRRNIQNRKDEDEDEGEGKRTKKRKEEKEKRRKRERGKGEKAEDMRDRGTQEDGRRKMDGGRR